jgi:hypothetical protein
MMPIRRGDGPRRGNLAARVCWHWEASTHNLKDFNERTLALVRNSAGGRHSRCNRQVGAFRHFGWIRHRGNSPQRLIPVAQVSGETAGFAGEIARHNSQALSGQLFDRILRSAYSRW